jgi:hypothetical protein
MKPPPMPEEVLRRVLVLARVNGLSVIVLAALGAVVSLLLGDLVGAVVGLLVGYGGWLEVSGGRRVAAGDIGGMRRLIQAQWFVLGPILVYCASRLASFDGEVAMSALSSEMRAELMSAGVDLSAVLPVVRLIFYFTYGTLVVATVLYQGGLARYYRRRISVVEQALVDRSKPAAGNSPRAGADPEDFVT